MSEYKKDLLNDTGIPDMRNAGVVLVYTEWNGEIVNELLSGCERMLQKHKVRHIVRLKVPGAVEIPFACKRYFESTRDTAHRPDAIIALGCVIRGGTPHFDYVCQAVTSGISYLNTQLPVPVLFGILTVDNLEQAQERAGGVHGHKGEEAALTAIKMIALNQALQ